MAPSGPQIYEPRSKRLTLDVFGLTWHSTKTPFPRAFCYFGVVAQNYHDMREVLLEHAPMLSCHVLPPRLRYAVMKNGGDISCHAAHVASQDSLEKCGKYLLERALPVTPCNETTT